MNSIKFTILLNTDSSFPQQNAQKMMMKKIFPIFGTKQISIRLIDRTDFRGEKLIDASNK